MNGSLPAHQSGVIVLGKLLLHLLQAIYDLLRGLAHNTARIIHFNLIVQTFAVHSAIEAIFVPDLVHKVFVLECFIEFCLLLLFGYVQSFLKSVMKVKVRLKFLVIAILGLLLELFHNCGI